MSTTRKSIPYALFWNWDHSTTWCLNVPGSQNAGVFNGYTKKPEYLEKDYGRMIDWAAENGINAVGMAGMLRDRHGGVETARKICAYGMDKGVRVYAIIGLFAYGGVFYEGNSPYSMSKFLEENPDCAGKDANGHLLRANPYAYYGNIREPQGCPSSPRLKEYILDSLDWLFKTIPELGGIQMESGDNGVCQCQKCKERRGSGAIKENMSVEDMARIYPDAAAVVRNRNKDAWVICETYHHFKDEAFKQPYSTVPPAFKPFETMPEATFFQWKCDQVLAENTWDENDRLPPLFSKFNNVMRSHLGTHWRGGLRKDFAVEGIRRQCRLSYTSGFNAVSLFGEDSTYYPNVEFNYLALRYFADNPMNTLQQFADDVMAPKLGSTMLAQDYVNMAMNAKKAELLPKFQRDIVAILSSLTNPEHIRRWINFADFIGTLAWENIAFQGR
ncbi:MAG: hypothetical protein GX561_08555 [Lentisphaerae bacterium]|nr:hypothetical protein [Lentisphaerota bacterium]